MTKKSLILLIFLSNILSICLTFAVVTNDSGRGLEIDCVPTEKAAIELVRTIVREAWPEKVYSYYEKQGYIWHCSYREDEGIWYVSWDEPEGEPVDLGGGGPIVKIKKETAEVVWMGWPA